MTDLDSIVVTAIKYLLGDGVAEDPLRALELLEVAAAEDHPEALFFAAEMHGDGEGVPVDRKKAFDYMQRSAVLGNINAIYSMGFCYMNGGMGYTGDRDDVLSEVTIPRDEAKGLAYYEQAAAQDHPLAIFRIARHYYYNSRNNERNLQQALKYYHRAIELGEASSMVDVADLHILGIGVAKDRDQAKRLYERAAATDDYCGSHAAADRLENFDELHNILQDDR